MRSTEISWQLDGIGMAGTAVRPDGDGVFPAVIFVAGSGPTDRDWCSPLLPGNNGSARLLAEALAESGIASLRYNKRVSGPHRLDNAQKLFGRLSMQSHLDELSAAIQALAALEFVDPTRIIGLGNSEGTLHLLHYTISNLSPELRGLVLAAPPGRPIEAVLLSQLQLQLAPLPGGKGMMKQVREATQRFSAGQAMDPDATLPDGVKAVLASFEAPANLPLARELWQESATDSLAKVNVPTLVLIGRKDIQIDTRADGEPLQQAAAGKPNISFAFPANANHILKEETRSIAELSKAPGTGYNEIGTKLDQESLTLILDWFARNVDH
ncbi:alpha/beta hydrolase family protein [Psychromicrobium lacuslunae]|uniref:AB hydrolase-1 domain-containing protein n=1 Tax=Psychromicrobium lacuslunae TaxID=1618207 RepID=A0A0D4BYA1_9MICC|nr:alpha/beta fold hydrolase [Psychromicrobium lacuslunae]AJT41066.1 hypothetical protein UM93_05200 [Psychromicrobium lacuslunae]